MLRKAILIGCDSKTEKGKLPVSNDVALNNHKKSKHLPIKRILIFTAREAQH